eukprot:15480191-Alexandrium_andersonii.AAC.1
MVAATIVTHHRRHCRSIMLMPAAMVGPRLVQSWSMELFEGSPSAVFRAERGHDNETPPKGPG